MIFSSNKKCPKDTFKNIVSKMDILLNKKANANEEQYSNKSGKKLEKEVYEALCSVAKGTMLEGSIELISGKAFPDIVAGGYYGIEVKSTIYDHWKTTGGSILESTRIPDVEQIYLTFGKLCKPIEFCSRPYEECLYDIAVTHYPRYKIDMKLSRGETIFDKMEMSYNQLRKMENPIPIVSSYMRKNLKIGERLWWSSDSDDESVAATIRLWKNLSVDEKNTLIVYGLVNFTEIFKGNYDQYVLWLTSQGIVNSHIRDSFSAGGKIECNISKTKKHYFPAIFKRIMQHRDLIAQEFALKNYPLVIEQCPIRSKELGKRIIEWAMEVSKYIDNPSYELTLNALSYCFFDKSYSEIVQKLA